MKGLEEAEKFYFQYGAPMIKSRFPEYENRIAAGLCGSGSECFGYDDELSRDHDFGGGFMLFLTEQDDIKTGVPLAREYKALAEKHGFVPEKKSALGRKRGVFTIEEFYGRYTGRRGELSTLDWLYIPSHALAEATNGRVFYDPLGEFTRVRKSLLDMPNEVRKKKLAARVLTIAQTGQYNFPRCKKRGEHGAAALALFRFCEAAVETVFLINRRHMPYYKWAFRAGKELPVLSDIVFDCERLLCEKCESPENLIEKICAEIRDNLKTEGFFCRSDFLEPLAFDIYSAVEDPELKRLHILEG